MNKTNAYSLWPKAFIISIKIDIYQAGFIRAVFLLVFY